jgi:invasion protein IalB
MDEIMSPICRHHLGFSCHMMGFVLRTIIAGSVGLASVPIVPVQAQEATKPPPAKSANQKPGTAQAAVPPSPGEPTLLAMYGEWGAYTATPNGKRVCFALAKPVSSSTVPPNRPRDPAWMFISSRPAEKVTNEVSVIFGYGLKANSDATMEIAGGSYAMNTQGDGAWVKNPAEEPKLVDILRKGADVTIKGTSAKGTVSTDVYSLKGLSQALDKIGHECH